MLISQTAALKSGRVLVLEDLGEDVFERAVIRLQDRVLGRQVDRVTALQPVGEDARAKSAIEALKLYMPIATPPSAENFATTCWIGSPPSSGVKVIVRLPAPGTLKLVALY